MGTQSFPNSDSPLRVTPDVNTLSFAQLHELCLKDNIIVVELPVVAFDLLNMETQSSAISKNLLGLSYTPGLVVALETKAFTLESMEEFYVSHWNDRDLFFFYTAHILRSEKMNADVYTIRYGKIEHDVIANPMKRYEAVERIKKLMNIHNTPETIKEYVNSENFSEDMRLANSDTSEMLKELNMYKAAKYAQEPTKASAYWNIVGNTPSVDESVMVNQTNGEVNIISFEKN